MKSTFVLRKSRGCVEDVSHRLWLMDELDSFAGDGVAGTDSGAERGAVEQWPQRSPEGIVPESRVHGEVCGGSHRNDH